MPINFENDVFPLYATNVVTDAEYLAIDPDRRDSVNEQKVLTAIEVFRSLMAELATDEQARVLHYAMGRMLAGTAYNTVYDDINVRVSGNVVNPHTSAANGDTITITNSTGTDAVVLAAAPYAKMADLVADINGQISNPTYEAYSNDGKLAFRNTNRNDGQPIEIQVGAGPSLLPKVGIEQGNNLNPVETAANAARDDALAHFERSANPVAL